MLCQKCSQAEATVHLTSLTFGAASESHLCAKCAAETGLVASSSIAPMLEVLQQALGAGKFGAELGGGQRQCPHCGMTLDDFRRTGRLGCPRDYEVFSDIFSELVERAHGPGARHVGKIPPNASPEARLAVFGARVDHLGGLLRAAVLREEYELAAKLRDQLASAEAEMRRLAGGAG